MAAPDTVLQTQGLASVKSGNVLVTPTGGAQATLAAALATIPIAPTLGTFVLNGATPVVVAAPAVTANSSIIITLKTVGGTVGAQPSLVTITPGTGFHVTGTALDTSTYNYLVIG